MEKTHTGQSSSSSPTYINYQGTTGSFYEQTLNPVYIDYFEEFKNKIVFIDLPSIEQQKNQTFAESIKSSLLGNESNIKDLEFLKNLKAIEATEELKSIDVLYKYISPLIDLNAYYRIDSICAFFRLLKFRLKLVVSLLTITHSKKDFLKSRDSLLEYAKEIGKVEGLSTLQIESILKGF